MVLLHHYNPIMAERFAKFPSDEWIAIGGQGRRAGAAGALAGGGAARRAAPRRRLCRRGRRPRARAGPPGRSRLPVPRRAQPTRRRRRSRPARTPTTCGPRPMLRPTHPSPTPAPRLRPRRRSKASVCSTSGSRSPGPWGTQMLADLGADVIKVNTLYDGYWMSNHIAMACNRGKRSISINLKDPNGMEILRRLVETADVVQHNMRYDAAVRLGVDYESLQEIKPDLIYCHTRGFEHGERELPARQRPDRRRAGGPRLARRRARRRRHARCGRSSSLGDTGNGFLSAIGDRAGALPPRPHRRGPVRRHVDHLRPAARTRRSRGSRRRQAQGRPPAGSTPMQLGWNALYRLYETRRRTWLCVPPRSKSRTGRHCARRSGVTTSRPTHASRPPTRARATTTTSTPSSKPCSRGRPRTEWFGVLDAAGVPVEVSTPDFVLGLFDDPEMLKRGWVTEYRHPWSGRWTSSGSCSTCPRRRA